MSVVCTGSTLLSALDIFGRLACLDLGAAGAARLPGGLDFMVVVVIGKVMGRYV